MGWQGTGERVTVTLGTLWLELGRVSGHALRSACQTCLVRNGKYFPKTCKNALRLLALGLSCSYLVHFSLRLFRNFSPCRGIFFFFFSPSFFLVLSLGWGTGMCWKRSWKERMGLGIATLLPPVPLTGFAPLNFHRIRLSLISVAFEMIYGTNGQENKLFLWPFLT